MKRSEMVAAIDNILCVDLFNPKKEPDGSWDSYRVSEEILQKIEDLGMSPPFNHDEYYKTWRNGGTGRVWENE